MHLEGFLFNRPDAYSKQEVSAKCHEVIFMRNGYVGISDDQRLVNHIYSIFACVTDIHGEREFLGSNPENFLSSFFMDPEVSLSQCNFGAVVTFDERRQILCLSRETFGLCPLYYICIPDELIAFSTDLRSLVTNKQLSQHISINRRRVASYSMFARDAVEVYGDETFYHNISTVLPGHSLELTLDGTRKATPFFKLSPSRWSHLRTLEEYGEEFRSKFSQSVSRCISDPTMSISAHLSGGLDSTSVTGMVRHLDPVRPIVTLYNGSNTLDTDENLFVRDVANELRTNHHEVFQSEKDFQLMSTYIHLMAGPSSTLLTPSFSGSMFHYAKGLGCDVVLNGTDGDSIAGSGFELTNRALEKRDWKMVEYLLKRRVKYYTYAYKYPNWSSLSEEDKYHLVLQNFLYARLSSKFLSSSLSEFKKLYAEVSRHFPVSYRYFASRGFTSIVNKFKKKQFKPSPHILTHELANELSTPRANENQLMKGLLETDASADDKQSILDVYTSQALLANEQNYIISKHYGIANGSPFYNKDLFEVCMAVPNLVKFGDGIGRSHFREAMRGITPESVRTRSTKTHIRAHGQDVIKRIYQQAKPLLEDSRDLWHYVDRKQFDQQIELLHNETVPYTHKINTWFLVSRTVSLAIWLDWLEKNKA